MFPSTVERVSVNTAQEVNEAIRRRMEESVAFHADAGPGAINRRLVELDYEWDIERLLEANAATLALVGVTLGATVDRRWYILPGIVAGFLLQHALQGWCPPIPLLRRLGIRTAQEINEEKNALKSLRGDFRGVSDMTVESRDGRVRQALHAARR